MLHVNFLTLLRALEVNIDLRHVNHIRYYYYYSTIPHLKQLKTLLELTVCSSSPSFVFVTQILPEIFDRECLGNSAGCLQNQANKIPGFFQDFQEFFKQFSRICLHKMSTQISLFIL